MFKKSYLFLLFLISWIFFQWITFWTWTWSVNIITTKPTTTLTQTQEIKKDEKQENKEIKQEWNTQDKKEDTKDKDTKDTKEIKEEKPIVIQDEKKDQKVSKVELIKDLAWTEEQKQIDETEKKIDQLKSQLEKLWISNQSIKDVEKNLKKEIENIKNSLDKQSSIKELEKENWILKHELDLKENVLQELNKEKITNELKKQELYLMISSYQDLKEKYEEKVVQKRMQKINTIILLWILYLIIYWSISFFSYLAKKTKINKETIDTIKSISISIVTIFIFWYILYIVLQIFEYMLYILLLALWSLVVAFKKYITSFFSFVSSIAFKRKIWMFVIIDNKPCKITKLNVFFTEVEIYWNDLSIQWKKTYFNDYFVIHSALLNIKELWVINTVKYKIKSNEHDETFISLLENLLQQETIEESQIDTILDSDKALLNYWYTIWKEWDDIEIVLTLKSLKWKNSKVFQIIKSIDLLVNFHKQNVKL